MLESGPCHSSASGHPAAASMANLACLISASRYHISERLVSCVFGPRVSGTPTSFCVTMRLRLAYSSGAASTSVTMPGTVKVTPLLYLSTMLRGSSPTSPARAPSRYAGRGSHGIGDSSFVNSCIRTAVVRVGIGASIEGVVSIVGVASIEVQ